MIYWKWDFDLYPFGNVNAAINEGFQGHAS